MTTKSVPYAFRKNGIYYFSRRVPVDLLKHYSATRISFSLKTRSAKLAASRANALLWKLERRWHAMRDEYEDDAKLSRLQKDHECSNSSSEQIGGAHALIEIKKYYQRVRGVGRGKSFDADLQRAFNYVIKATGKRYLDGLEKRDAIKFREFLERKNLKGPSIKRIFGTIRAAINFYISEFALNVDNPFRNIYIDVEKGKSKRIPIPETQIRKLQTLCRLQEDQARTLINVISDTGMRLAEASGLVKSDLFLYHKVPYLQVVSHPWRSLKTKSSKRLIPLTNNVLTSLVKLKDEVDGEFLFPQYNKGEYTNANSASATLNKWIKSEIGGEYTVHSLRHSFRDRLRAAECPADIINQLGGWHTDGIGNQYGNGYTVEVLGKWIRLLE